MAEQKDIYVNELLQKQDERDQILLSSSYILSIYPLK